MPSVYDYRHIELDRVGTGKKRIVTPASSSESADVFGRKLPSSPSGSIFSTSPTPLSRSSSRRSSFRCNEDTKARLFGPADNSLARKVNNHFRSSILSTESLNAPSPSPSKRRRKWCQVHESVSACVYEESDLIYEETLFDDVWSIWKWQPRA